MAKVSNVSTIATLNNYCNFTKNLFAFANTYTKIVKIPKIMNIWVTESFTANREQKNEETGIDATIIAFTKPPILPNISLGTNVRKLLPTITFKIPPPKPIKKIGRAHV